MNREAWLTEVAARIQPVFSVFHLDRIPYRVTCGWPVAGGMSPRNRRVGECHSHRSSKGGVHELFISPYLAEPLEVAGTLCHELAHVAAGVDAAHGKGFVKVCRHVGLTKGKPKCVMPGEQLNERLAEIIQGLPPYPHQALVGVPKEKQKKDPTSVKLACKNCECEIRISFKHLDAAGPPTCGCGGEMGVDGGE